MLEGPVTGGLHEFPLVHPEEGKGASNRKRGDIHGVPQWQLWVKSGLPLKTDLHQRWQADTDRNSAFGAYGPLMDCCADESTPKPTDVTI